MTKKNRTIDIMGVSPLFKDAVMQKKLELNNKGVDINYKGITTLLAEQMKEMELIDAKRLSKKKEYVIKYKF